ncbi:hypothetical protein BASA50_007775 [Batrachochytrium salamandrivorans]|uniref:Uncharacterized protein n=1 Tax=Batrachochytrium salamandrivorans TaxID=1357716 RepID=A0ABQ8F9F9_9FUNG|nr:hypothetical protein BASA50_007775 [Batrachochytrium salamandrivorans]
MRVGVGVILSVLSFSVLSAVIPNYDDHGLLLARRTVNTETRAVLWKRADEEQQDLFLRAQKLVLVLKLVLVSVAVASATLVTIVDQRIIWNRGEKLIKNAVKRVTEAVEGGEARQALLDINDFLNITLKLSQKITVIFNSKSMMPLLLSNPKGDNQKSFIKKMTKMQNIGKGHAKKHFEDLTRAITAITKRPQDVITEIGKITESISRMTQEYRKDMSSVFKYIKGLINGSGVTFKVRARSKFSTLKSGVKNRLGIKKKSSTGIPSDQEELDQEESAPESLYQGELNLGPSNQEPSDGNTSNQGPSNQGPSDENTSGQESSKQGPPGQQAPDQAGERPTPAPRKSKLNRQATIV